MSSLKQDMFDKWYGLMNDNPMKGSLTKAVNVTVEEGGAYLESRLGTQSVLGPVSCSASRGIDSVNELVKTDGTKYVIMDVVSVNESGTVVRKVIGAQNTSTTNDLAFGSVSVIIPSVSVSGNPSYVTARNKSFRADGNTENYVISALNDYGTVGVAAPTSISASSTSGGSILAGNYRVYVRDVKKDATDSSYIHVSDVSAPVDVTVSGNAISVTVAATDNADVTHKWIYRTVYGDPSTDPEYGNAYYAAEIVNTSATITLTAADDTINTQTGIYIVDILGGRLYPYGIPPKADFVLFAQDRMFYGVKSESRLYYSEVGYPESVGTTSYTTPYEREDGDELTGGLAFQNTLLIFKKYKTFVVDLLGEDYPATKLSSRIGCIDSRTIKATGSSNSAMWLSSEGVILYKDGAMANVTTGKIYKSIIRPYILNGAEFIAEYYPDRNQYHLMMFYRNAAETAIVDHKHLVFSLNSGEWTEFYDRESAGGGTYNQLASIAAGIVTDGKGKQAMVTASLTFGGTTVYLKQWDVLAADVGATLSVLNTTPVGVNWSYTSFLFDGDGDKYYTTWGRPDNLNEIGNLTSDGVGGIYAWDGSAANDGFSQVVDFSGYTVDYDVFTLSNNWKPYGFAKNGNDFYVSFDSENATDKFYLKMTAGGSGQISMSDVYYIDEIPETAIHHYLTNRGGQGAWIDENFQKVDSPFVILSDGTIVSSDTTADNIGVDGKWMVLRWTFGSGYSVTIDFSTEILTAYSTDPNYTDPPAVILPVAQVLVGDNYNILCFAPYLFDGDMPVYTLFCATISKFSLNVLRDVILSDWNEDAEMEWRDPEFHIQTAFDDHGAPHLKKTMQKIQLPISASAPMCGLVHVQPDFEQQNYIGITDAAATPRYSSSPIVHEGLTTVDTNDIFTTDEQIRQESMGVNVSGKRIRIAVRGGSAGGETGQMKIYPPVFHLRYWGQNDRNKRG